MLHWQRGFSMKARQDQLQIQKVLQITFHHVIWQWRWSWLVSNGDFI
jgi:hypothetical protein